MPPHDRGVGQGQSLSRSLPHRFGREERLENPRARCFWYSRSGVGNRDLRPISGAHGGDDNFAFPLRTVSHGLFNRLRGIDGGSDDLVKLAGVAKHPRQLGVKMGFHLRHVLPHIARHGDGGLDRLVDVD